MNRALLSTIITFFICIFLHSTPALSTNFFDTFVLPPSALSNAVLPDPPTNLLASSEQSTNLWFTIGERFSLVVNWKFLTVAESIVWTEWIEYEGRKLIAIRVRNRSYGVLDLIFPVNDFLESVVEPSTFLPVWFVKNLSEGRYRLHEITIFDHKNKKAQWRHLLRGTNEVFNIEADTRDILSFMYFMRQTNFNTNAKYAYKVMADEKLYDLKVATKNYEDLTLPTYGRVKALYVYPEAEFQGLCVRRGKAELWISNDKRNLMVQGIVHVPVAGTIKVLINRVYGGANDFWSNPPETNEKTSSTIDEMGL